MTSDQLSAYAEALFSTPFQPSDELTGSRVRAAVAFRVSMMTVSEIAAMVAYEYGDHPDTAPARMRWALETVAAAYEMADAR